MSTWADWHAPIVSGERRDGRALVARLFLALAAGPYALAVMLRNLLYDWGWLRRHRAACPVISVGILTVGGTGKTPAVEFIARRLRQRDCRVAILSRGYGAPSGRNDEALVLEENLPDVPHLQGPDRVELARIAVEELEAELVLLDDGFQHRRLHRDLNIALIDATCPWGHGWVLPRGLLREPRRGLRRADLVLLTRCDQVDATERDRLHRDVGRWAPGRPIVESQHAAELLCNADGAEQPVASLRGQVVAAFCGLGRPQAFFRQLEQLGARVAAERTFPDHHPYSREDVADLERWARTLPPEAWLLTSQKDLVKLRIATLADRPLWALRIQLRLTAHEADFERCLSPFLPEDAHGRQSSLSAL